MDAEDLRSLLIYAYRYAMTRRSYAVVDGEDLVKKYGKGVLTASDYEIMESDAREHGRPAFAEYCRTNKLPLRDTHE